ncbi:CopG family ribbon-helix-helix protein [Vibrio alginolyticus]|uniref:CopG family ribbon-helix-helix protein n=1 Tax=Vibrio alginolyticus TaxID=663 RepID=UPI002119BB04|nr:CopG family ribbon-helix-helix protein [Vibrio alginolyticus]MCQ9091219.1 ribbon-helix-helix protein, CopG family [Vibrio alginolyticus]
MASMSVRIPDEIEDKLAQLAKSTGRTKSWLTNQAIQDYLARELWQVNEINQAIKEADAGEFASTKDVVNTFSKWGINGD